MTPTLDPNSQRDPLDLLAEEMVERFRRGEEPCVDDYIKKYPHLAEQIRQTLPAVLMLERLKPLTEKTGADKEAGRVEPQLERIGDYRIVREIGRGGMGIVYEAEQRSLARRVALKILPHATALTGQNLRRFELEARAAARLHHTNIVPVFGVGEANGLHYYVMQLIHGHGLDSMLAQKLLSNGGLQSGTSVGAETEVVSNRPQGPLKSASPSRIDSSGGLRTASREPAERMAAIPSAKTIDFDISLSHAAARIGVQVAEALQYAHEAGTLHRDIKPSNLLLDREGTVWITDFGLAKLYDQPEITHASDILGTLRYMAPERFAGRCDARSDIYSLGLVLYELVTLRVAHAASSRQALIHDITHVDPLAPRQINRNLPLDLETIILKSIARDPSDRYQAAGQIAGDLRRFLQDEPISARPPNTFERLHRWYRRNRTVASLIGCTALLLIATAIGSVVMAARFRYLAAQQTLARHDADEARSQAEGALAEVFPANGIDAARRGKPAEAALWFANAAHLARLHNGNAAVNELRASTWARSTFTPVAAMRMEDGRVDSITFSPDDRYLVVRRAAGADSIAFDHCQIWDIANERQVILPSAHPAQQVIFSPDGRHLAFIAGGESHLCSWPLLPQTAPAQHLGQAAVVAFSHNSRWLAIAGQNEVRLLDCPANHFDARRLRTGAIQAIWFAPSDDRLLVASADGTLRLFAMDQSKPDPVFSAVRHQYEVGAPLFLREGRQLLTVEDLLLTWHQCDSGAVIRQISLQQKPTWISSDASNRFVAIGCGDQIKVIDTDDGSQLGNIAAHGQTFQHGIVSPDGSMLLTTCPRQSPAFWSIPGGTRMSSSIETLGPTDDTSISNSSRLIASLEGDLVRIWAKPSRALDGFRVPFLGQCASFRFDRAGRYVLADAGCGATGWLAATQVYDLETSAPVGAEIDPGGMIHGVDFAPDGTRIATVSDAMERAMVIVWDWKSGRRLGREVELPERAVGLAYSPDGNQIAVRSISGHVYLIDLARSSVSRSWACTVNNPAEQTFARRSGMCFSGDGRSIVTWGSKDVEVWDTSSGQRRFGPLSHLAPVTDVSYSPDERFLATACADGLVQVWDAATGQRAASPLTHEGMVYDVRWLPGGHELLTACGDGTARLWEWEAGRLARTLAKEDNTAYLDDATPDGRWILTTAATGTLRVWERQSGLPITPSIPLSGIPWGLEASSNGRFAALAMDDYAFDVIRLDPLNKPQVSEDLRPWCELVCGSKLESGRTIRLSSDEWLKSWRRQRASGMTSKVTVSSSEMAQWHRGRAAEAQIEQNEPSIAFHIGKLFEAGAASAWESRQAACSFTNSYRWNEAERYFRAAVQNRPNDWRLRLELGQALIALGRWDEAAEEFKSAINLRAGHNWIRGNWWTQGPFRASLTDPLPPDTKVDVSAAVAGKFTPTGDSAEALRWRLTNVAGPWVYFHTYYKNAEHVTAYALCFIYTAREQQVALSIGVDDMGRISMNGKQVYEYANPAHASAPGDGRALVTLKRGWNTLLAKVYNVLGGHTLYAELSDDPRDIAAARTASQQPNVTSSIKK